MSNDPASLHPTSAAAHMIMLPYSEGGSSAPPSPRDEASDLVFVTYNGRQVVLGWSPSLEETKATACNDLGLTERGYSGRDIAFFFHPANDPANRPIEVLASAWPKLRPLPHLQLVLRTDDDASHSAHHPVFQRTQAGHPGILRTQPSTLTTSGRSQKSREGDYATPSNTEASNSSLRVDIENWRRNQTSPFYQAGQPGGYSHQINVNLPQHALPSPPLSDAQSHRGPSLFYDQNSPTSPSSHHSGNMEIGKQHALNDSPLSSLHDHPVPSSTGFLAQTGRRTTVHFPHTLPSAKLEILAPTPIRKSHSQELLNANYTDFKPGQPQGPYAQAQTRNRSATTHITQHLPVSKPGSRHQIQESSSAHKARTYSQVCSSNTLQYSAQPSARAFTRASSLKNSWEASIPAANNENACIAQDARPTPRNIRNLGPAGMQRSSSHSTLNLGIRPSQSSYDGWCSPPPIGYDSRFRTIGTMSVPLGAPFNMKLDPFGPRRASLPDALHPSTATSSVPITLSAGSTPVQLSSSGQRKFRPSTRATLPLVDVEMDNEGTGSDEDASPNNGMDQEPSTPRRLIPEKTLRRLKSSPSGLADQYNRQLIPIEMPMHIPGPNHLAPAVSQLTSSTKRGPTSWPNSPVKRNTSLFAQRPEMQLKDGFSMMNIPLAPPAMLDATASKTGKTISSKKKEQRGPMSPPPPLLPSADSPTETVYSRNLLDGAIPPFLLDKKRPDSPMPPLYPFRSLPSSPQAKMNQIAFNAVINDSEMTGSHFGSSNTTEDYPRLQQRFRGRNSQNAEDLFEMADTPSAGPLPDYLPLQEMRSELNLSTPNKTRRSRTH